MDVNNKLSLEYLITHESSIHVVGRTSYRTALVKNEVFRCERDEFSFLENRISSKDNHVVLLFQVLFGKFQGIYYAFLHDSYCIVGEEIVFEDF